ncbi:dihydrofolate reductase family protein [Sphingosinicella sp.]|uniref:dihydrofolate reductase family protein n=1 Tax=Sphingosinicella sp. TaxID=1917971 RepID=UPI0040379B42
MRKATYGAAVSLDGFLAGPDEALDWLLWSDDAKRISAESWRGVDTILMGRKTYEFAAKSGGGGGGSSKLTTYIFSRKMTEAPDGAELVGEDAAAFVRGLKQQPGGDIIVMGGGELGAALIDGGVVDEIGLNVHPILLGGGVPMFPPMARRAELRLIEARPIERGCVFLRYAAGSS